MARAGRAHTGPYPPLRQLSVYEEGSKKLVILPAADLGEAWGVVMDGEGRRDPLTREMALEWVERAFENNQPLWIVVKSESKPKHGFLRRKPKT